MAVTGIAVAGGVLGPGQGGPPAAANVGAVVDMTVDAGARPAERDREDVLSRSDRRAAVDPAKRAGLAPGQACRDQPGGAASPSPTPRTSPRRCCREYGFSVERVQLPGEPVGARVRLEPARAQPVLRRPRHPAVPSGLEDGERGLRLVRQPRHPDQVGTRLHQVPLRHAPAPPGATARATTGTELDGAERVAYASLAARGLRPRGLRDVRLRRRAPRCRPRGCVSGVPGVAVWPSGRLRRSPHGGFAPAGFATCGFAAGRHAAGRWLGRASRQRCGTARGLASSAPRAPHRAASPPGATLPASRLT